MEALPIKQKLFNTLRSNCELPPFTIPPLHQHHDHPTMQIGGPEELYLHWNSTKSLDTWKIRLDFALARSFAFLLPNGQIIRSTGSDLIAFSYVAKDLALLDKWDHSRTRKCVRPKNRTSCDMQNVLRLIGQQHCVAFLIYWRWNARVKYGWLTNFKYMWFRCHEKSLTEELKTNLNKKKVEPATFFRRSARLYHLGIVAI